MLNCLRTTAFVVLRLHYKFWNRNLQGGQLDTGWILVGDKCDLQIAMVKAENQSQALFPYDQAKRIALEKLRDHVAPYLDKIEQLESDLFLTMGALPPLRAWQSESRGRTVIVTAKSKKRAMEIVREGRHSFDNYWRECVGVWWYSLAHEESLWIQEKDKVGGNIREFQRCLTPDEAEVILNEHAAHYRDGDIEELLIHDGEERIETGVSSSGTAYRIKTTSHRNSNDESRIEFRCGIEDCFGAVWHRPVFVERTLPQREVVAVGNWKEDGF